MIIFWLAQLSEMKYFYISNFSHCKLPTVPMPTLIILMQTIKFYYIYNNFQLYSNFFTLFVQPHSLAYYIQAKPSQVYFPKLQCAGR